MNYIIELQDRKSGVKLYVENISLIRNTMKIDIKITNQLSDTALFSSNDIANNALKLVKSNLSTSIKKLIDIRVVEVSYDFI